MPARMAPELRAAILKDIRAGRLSRNQVARKYSVSASTVGRISAAEGITDAWDRTNALKGARARAADNKAMRAQLQSDLLRDAQKLRKRAWSAYPVVVGGPEGAEKVWLDEPPLPDVRAAYTSIGIIVDKDLAYERASATSDGAAAAESLMGRIAAALTEAAGGPQTPPGDS